jgi:acyl-coenzyme A thioesterase PaaI-like protein
LTVDFTASATLGDWLSATVETVSCGKRLGFANCYLAVGDKRVARASGVFSVVPRKQ